MSVRGVEALERQVLAASPVEGLVLRYGRLYGSGSGTDTPPGPPSLHVDAAAYAALLAMDHGEPGPSTSPIPMTRSRPTKPLPRLAGAQTFGWTRPRSDAIQLDLFVFFLDQATAKGAGTVPLDFLGR